ncbi:MAG: hypothetical protein AAFV96_12295, partial [Pseudomonadota bacterium]
MGRRTNDERQAKWPTKNRNHRKRLDPTQHHAGCQDHALQCVKIGEARMPLRHGGKGRPGVGDRGDGA